MATISALEYTTEQIDSFNLLAGPDQINKGQEVQDVIDKNSKMLDFSSANDNYSKLKLAHDDYEKSNSIIVEDSNIDNLKDNSLKALEQLKQIKMSNKVIFNFLDVELKNALGIEPPEGIASAALVKLEGFLNDDTDYNTLKNLLEDVDTVGKFKGAIENLAYKNSFGQLKILRDFLEKYEEEASKNEFTNKEFNINSQLKQLAAIVFNDCLFDASSINDCSILHEFKHKINDTLIKIDQDIQTFLDQTLHNDDFKSLEANWRALEYLVNDADFSKDIKIDLLDVTKDELNGDFSENQIDISNGEFFKKVYTREYDQYGGQPYGLIIGLYEFKNTKEDRDWLKVMGKIANAAHAPFVASVGAEFFVNTNDINKLAEIKDLRGHMSLSQFDQWNKFRDSEEAAYLGFTVPNFMIRMPYDQSSNPVIDLNYTETIESHNDYIWANGAILFARNTIKSYENTSWCQTIRGPKNGGKLENLPRHIFEKNGLKLEKVPVEMVIPDYRELDFSDNGFMALIYEKETSNACFFSSQSIKKSKKFKDPVDSENSQLVTNLSYTLSITKIAHYIKSIMRDNIGGSADAAYINKTIENWLSGYVTTVVNPDDLTLTSYPFKAMSVETTEREGFVGWYDCVVKVSPHRQFEGLDTELRLETRL